MRFGFNVVQKPENVLLRAEELVAVGKKESALRLIFDILSTKRGRTWSQAHEKMMLRYLDLCLEVKNSQYAKEGLHQFRNLSITQAPSSLEKVIDHLLTSAENKTVAAAESCNVQTLLHQVDDIDKDLPPESILLDIVNPEKSKDRTEREVLLPWLKFVYESFKLVLDLLRNQPKLQNLYHGTARRAFLFCQRYHRISEFRRICELLRTHLNNPKHYNYKTEETQLETPESISLHLETRFEQLNISCELRLWVGGFRTIQDIHQIMKKTGFNISTRLLGVYYDKLAELFLISSNYLFHAYALKKLFLIRREKKKGVVAEELEELASSVVLAGLSIRLRSSRAGTTMEEELRLRENKDHWAELLGFEVNPKRSVLLKNLQAQKILQNSFEEVQELYRILESDMSAEDSLVAFMGMLQFLNQKKRLKSYILPIEKLFILKYVVRLGYTKESYSLKQLKQDLAKLSTNLVLVEKIVVEAIQSRQTGGMKIRINHSLDKISFGKDFFEDKGTKKVFANNAKRLSKILFDHKMQNKNDLKFSTVLNEIKRDHAFMLKRKDDLQKAREFRSNKLKEQADEKLRELNAKNRSNVEQETLRLQQELKRQEEEKKAKDEKIRKVEETVAKLEILGVTVGEEEISKLNEKQRVDLIAQKEEELKQQEKEALEKRKRRLKAVDVFVRASRKFQKSKLQTVIRRLREEYIENHDAKQRKDVELSRNYHERALLNKPRFQIMKKEVYSYREAMLTKWEEQQLRDKLERKRLVQMEQARQKLERARERLRLKKESERREKEEKERVKRIEEERQQALEQQKLEEAFKTPVETRKNSYFEPSFEVDRDRDRQSVAQPVQPQIPTMANWRNATNTVEENKTNIWKPNLGKVSAASNTSTTAKPNVWRSQASTSRVERSNNTEEAPKKAWKPNLGAQTQLPTYKRTIEQKQEAFVSRDLERENQVEGKEKKIVNNQWFSKSKDTQSFSNAWRKT